MSFLKKLTSTVGVVVISSTILLSSFSNFVNADNQRWNLGDLTNTGKDNGYSGNNAIDNDDPHYGWTLGQFYVSGYTQHTNDSDGTDVFLKNVGDQVELHFELLQDIDELNGDDNLTINADENGYDQYFGTQQFNDCRGLLIIRKTDYQNATADPVIYEDYLDGVDQGADTVVELCEEGDYEVALDYEIKEDHYGVDWNQWVSVPTYTNYRIYFTFRIRNGNCMVFPFDTATGSELSNESFTDNGFYLDLANSRYLDINVQRSVYVEGNNGYTEDVRFNRPASDGTEYTDEGIYTITVSNNYTNQETTKVIYVGTDPMMRAFVVSGYTLEELQDYISQGYQISDDGSLIPPESTDEIIEETVVENVSDDEADSDESSTDNRDDRKSDKKSKKKEKSFVVPLIVVVSILISGVGIFLFIKRDRIAKRNISKESNDTLSNESTIVTEDETSIVNEGHEEVIESDHESQEE